MGRTTGRQRSAASCTRLGQAIQGTSSLAAGRAESNHKPMSKKSKPNGPEKMNAKTYEKELR